MQLQKLAVMLQPSWHSSSCKGETGQSHVCDVAEPAVTPADRLPQDYLQRVKAIHEEGGFGSIGFAPYTA